MRSVLISRRKAIWVVVVFGLIPGTPRALQAQNATAPTASQDPALVDQAWQKASSKYDGQRASLLQDVDKADQQGPFGADWESLRHYEAPDWYKDAKFGIFIHWGVYSVPAFGNEWYPRSMYQQGSDEYKHHIATYGTQDKFGYKDFVPLFKAEQFDPAAWAELFKMALPCMTAALAIGPPPKWALIATSSATSPKQFAPRACTLAFLPIVWNTIFFSA